MGASALQSRLGRRPRQMRCETLVMARTRKSRTRNVTAQDALPDDLYDYARPPARRAGRPAPEDTITWTVTDDWPEDVPISTAARREPGARRHISPNCASGRLRPTPNPSDSTPPSKTASPILRPDGEGSYCRVEGDPGPGPCRR